jgi:hypothetical protein
MVQYLAPPRELCLCSYLHPPSDWKCLVTSVITTKLKSYLLFLSMLNEETNLRTKLLYSKQDQHLTLCTCCATKIHTYR